MHRAGGYIQHPRSGLEYCSYFCYCYLACVPLYLLEKSLVWALFLCYNIFVTKNYYGGYFSCGILPRVATGR